MKRPQKLAVMLVPTPPYEICGLALLHFFGHLEPEKAKAGSAAQLRAIIHYRELKDCYEGTDEHEVFQTEQRAVMNAHRDELAEFLTRDEINGVNQRHFFIEFFDVWGEDSYFGAAPEPEVLREVIKILTPPDFAAYSLANLKPFDQLTWKKLKVRNIQLRKLLGKKSYAHFRKFTETRRTSLVPWEPPK